MLEKQRATRRHWQFVPRDSACEGHLEQLGVADDQVRNSFDAWFSPGTTRVVVKDSITDPAAKLLEERGR